MSRFIRRQLTLVKTFVVLDNWGKKRHLYYYLWKHSQHHPHHLLQICHISHVSPSRFSLGLGAAWQLAVAVSHRSRASASPRWGSCPSWCRRSSPRRRRRTTCSGGRSPCGSRPAASAGATWAPWPCCRPGSASQSTCQPAGSTWRSPWCVRARVTTDHRAETTAVQGCSEQTMSLPLLQYLWVLYYLTVWQQYLWKD